MRGSADFESISSAFKRMKNILRQAAEKTNVIAMRVDPAGLQEESERELAALIPQTVARVEKPRAARNYEGALLEIHAHFRQRPVHHPPRSRAALLEGARQRLFEQPDHIVEKTRFGAFVPGASHLHELLQSHGVDTLIVTGTLTNCCCESTARDAMQMNYKVIFVSDATATLTDAAHNATLENMAMLFADVMTTREVLTAVTLRGAESPDLRRGDASG